VDGCATRCASRRPAGPSRRRRTTAADPVNTFWAVFTGTLAIGWGATAAYAEYRRRRRARRRERYLEGLRFLLDDKPERALEVFLGLAANDDETIDNPLRARQPVPAPGRSGPRHSRCTSRWSIAPASTRATAMRP